MTATPRAASGQTRDARYVLEFTGAKGGLNCGKENVSPNRRNKAANKTRGNQRECEDVPANRAFPRGGNALAVKSQRTINNESRP
jgi:hypothetical protein